MSLDYQREIMAQVLSEDALWVLAKGIGLDDLYTALLKVYCHPQTLVFVINGNPKDDGRYVDALREAGIVHLPRIITNEVNASERQEMYSGGGVFLITSRILIIDFLNQRIPKEKLSGIIVLNAHTITNTSTEAFILRVYREQNKTGFIKAFTEHAESLVGSFMKMEKLLKTIFLKNIFLWPRFHLLVCESLERNQPEVIEINVELTPSMLKLQNLIVEMIASCLTELKQTNKIEIRDLTVENCLFKSFDGIIRNQLDPIWHTLGLKTKSLVSDLKTLRKLLTYVTKYDCVTFLGYLESIRASEGPYGTSRWLYLDQAPRVFQIARKRVYNDPSSKEALQKVLEANPKWEVMSDILQEIQEESTKAFGKVLPNSVFIVVKDERTRRQLHDYLSNGAEKMLENKFRYFQQRKDVSSRVSTEAPLDIAPDHVPVQENLRVAQSRGRGRGAQSSGKVTKKKMTSAEMLRSTLIPYLKPSAVTDLPAGPSEAERSQKNEDDEQPVLFEEPSEVLGQLPEHIHLVLADEIESFLKIFTPVFVIFFDSNVRIVRLFEVYKARHPGSNLRIYFLTYEKSVEQQKYISSTKKEKDSFDQLIKAKSTMLIDSEQDGKLDSLSPSKSLSLMGNSKSSEVPQVIIDIREFRSALPSLLQGRGIRIVPITLEVGDYVLSPEICVERKSISDLFGSFASGRLFTQAETMTKFYKSPILLIEFEQTKSFSLQAPSDIPPDISPASINSKISLLCLHFPTLRIVWSRSPYHTAELFEKMKRHQDQPDAAVAMSIGVEDGNIHEYNTGPHEVLKRIPGVTPQNIWKVMNRVENLAELSKMTLREQIALVGARNGALMHDFFNKRAHS